MEHPTIFLNRLAKFALIPIGLLLLLAAAWSVWSTKTWLARTLEVEGVVIEMVRMRDSDDKGYLFSPIVRFETRAPLCGRACPEAHSRPTASRRAAERRSTARG